MALEKGIEVGAGFPPDSRSFLFPLDNSCLSESPPEAFGTGLKHVDVDDSCTGKGAKDTALGVGSSTGEGLGDLALSDGSCS